MSVPELASWEGPIAARGALALRGWQLPEEIPTPDPKLPISVDTWGLCGGHALKVLWTSCPDRLRATISACHAERALVHWRNLSDTRPRDALTTFREWLNGFATRRVLARHCRAADAAAHNAWDEAGAAAALACSRLYRASQSCDVMGVVSEHAATAFAYEHAKRTSPYWRRMAYRLGVTWLDESAYLTGLYNEVSAQLSITVHAMVAFGRCQ